MCLAGARSTAEYQSLLEANAFTKVRSQSVNWAITKMLDRIEKQLALVERINANQALPGEKVTELPGQLQSEDFGWLDEGLETLNEVRGFADSGGFGYVMMTARPAKTA